jgi:hypothetical protein
VVLVLWSDWDIRLSFRRSGLGSFSFKGGGLGCFSFKGGGLGCFSFKGGGLGSFSFKGGSLGCFLWGDFWEGAAPLTTPLWFYWNYCFSLYRNYWFWTLYWNYWFWGLHPDIQVVVANWTVANRCDQFSTRCFVESTRGVVCDELWYGGELRILVDIVSPSPSISRHSVVEDF